jgi:hypothetical protein
VVEAKMRGPIDYIVVAFPGNNFKGEILNELKAASEAGTIAVLDLAMIIKDEDGDVASIELAASEDPLVRELAKLHTGRGGLIKADDIVEVGEILEDSSSAGLLIIEHLWAKPLKQAIMNTGGVLIAEGRIHPEASLKINQKMGV